MQISGFQKTTVLDFPGHLAAIVFTKGCNYRCPFCQNGGLLKSDVELIDEREILDYLKKRKNVLEGLTISGGEPTIQEHLEDFIKEVRSYGYKIKLDTNGSNPSVIRHLIEERLLDYIAMDIKNDFTKYEDISGVAHVDTEKIKESIAVIKNSGIDHEFRTTIVKEFHTIDDIENICRTVSGSKYFVQNFEDSKEVLKSGLHGFTKKELEAIEEKIKKIDQSASVRGL